MRGRLVTLAIVSGGTLLQAPTCDQDLLGYRIALAIRSLIVDLLGIAIDNAIID